MTPMWIIADLTFDTDAEAREAERLAKEGKLSGVSVDIGNVTEEIEILETDDEGFPVDWLATISKGEILGATQLPMPAFAEARIEFTDIGPLVFLAPEGVKTSDRRFISEGALSWRDPSPLMFSDSSDGHDGAIHVGNLTNFRRMGLVAADLSCLTKPQISEGRIEGHGAGWGTCHTAFRNACVTAPNSPSGYALVGDAVKLYKHPRGDIHAPLYLSTEEAMEWYDRECERVGLCAVGEDDYGIWVSGETALPDGEVFLSGDWRVTEQGLDLISFLVVDRPGFPTALVASDVQSALVGAGIVVETKPDLDRRVADLEAAIQARDLLEVLI